MTLNSNEKQGPHILKGTGRGGGSRKPGAPGLVGSDPPELEEFAFCKAVAGNAAAEETRGRESV